MADRGDQRQREEVPHAARLLGAARPKLSSKPSGHLVRKTTSESHPRTCRDGSPVPLLEAEVALPTFPEGLVGVVGVDAGDQLAASEEQLGHGDVLQIQPVGRGAELERLTEDLILVDAPVMRRDLAL